MRLLKNSWFVCCQNFRKWRHDYRIILAAILILIEVNYFSGSLGTICSSLGLKKCLPGYFRFYLLPSGPALFSFYHCFLSFATHRLLMRINLILLSVQDVLHGA